MNELKDLKDQLNRIERCLVGDPAMGQTGLVPGYRVHGARISKLERWRDTSKVKIAAIITTSSVFVTGAAWLLEHLAKK